MIGRPTDYTEELADDICARLSEGESLVAITSASDMPNRKTIYRWLDAHADFSHKYARAREEQADHFAELAIEESAEIEDAAIARVRIDTLKWAAGQMKPGKWGPRKIVEDGPERARGRKSAAESVARVLELATGGRPRSVARTSGDETPEQGSNEFPVIRQSH